MGRSAARATIGGVKASDVARAERTELCDLFLEVGPDAPTLCEGWTTRDLAAHLAVREGRPDAAGGILGGPLAGYAASVQQSYAERPWPDLVATVRTGPPLYSPMRWADGLANLFEFAVHHEDVRRATPPLPDGSPSWQPRELPPEEQDLLWARLTKATRLLARKVPVGLVLVRSDTGQRHVAKAGSPSVTLTGAPLELLLRLFGRHAVVLDISGDEEAVARFASARLGV